MSCLLGYDHTVHTEGTFVHSVATVQTHVCAVTMTWTSLFHGYTVLIPKFKKKMVFVLLQKGNDRKGFSHPEGGGGGGTKRFGVVLKWVLEVITILEGVHKRFPPSKSGGVQSFTLTRLYCQLF